MSVEIHQQLFLPWVDLEAVLVAPVHKVLDKFSVGPVIIVSHEANDCRELLQMATR